MSRIRQIRFLIPLAAFAPGCDPPMVLDPEPFVFRRTELHLALPADLREPIEAKLIATLAFYPVSPKESWPAPPPVLSFDESTVIGKAVDGEGHPLALKHVAFSHGGRRLVSLEGDFTLEPEHTVTIEYTVQPRESRFIEVRSEKVLLAFSGSEIAPRILNYRSEACPRTIRVLWRTQEPQAILAGPGGAVRLVPAPGGGIRGEIRTGEGEVGFNDFLVSTFRKVVENGKVSVFTTVSEGTSETYEKVAAIVARVAALYEAWLGPLDRPITAIECGDKRGHGLFPGVVVLPTKVFALPEPDVWAVQHLAHELAHAYFGNGVLSFAPGGAVIEEGIAEYLALLAVEELRGRNALRMVLLDYRDAATSEPSLPVPLRMIPGQAALPALGYIRGAYFFRMLEARIGRDEVLSFLSRTWRENRWSEYSLERLTGDPRLQDLWRREPRGPAWAEFIECWLGESSSLPELSFDRGGARAAGNGFETTVVIRNAGGCPADVPVEFRGAGGESAIHRVYVSRRARLTVFLPWRPVAAVLDPQLCVFETATETRTLRLSSRGSGSQ